MQTFLALLAKDCKALKAASISSSFICRKHSSGSQGPLASKPCIEAPQPVRQASEKITKSGSESAIERRNADLFSSLLSKFRYTLISKI